MAKGKTPPHVVERILNHTTGTLGGVAGVYNQYGYLDEMRIALEGWQNIVCNFTTRSIEKKNQFELEPN